MCNVSENSNITQKIKSLLSCEQQNFTVSVKSKIIPKTKLNLPNQFNFSSLANSKIIPNSNILLCLGTVKAFCSEDK